MPEVLNYCYVLSDGRWDVHLENIDEGNYSQPYGVTSNRYIDGSKCSIDIAYSMVPKFGNGKLSDYT